MTKRLTQFWKVFTDALAGVAGADKEALQKAPSARTAFVALGMTVVVTSGAAALSAFFAFHDAIGVPAGLAVVPAIAWGLVIFALDRMLITVAMGSSTTATLSTAFFRVVAAVLIGVIVSTPLTLRAFADDVRYQLGVMRLENAEQIQGQIDEFKVSTVDVIQEDISEQQNILAGAMPPDLDTSDSAEVVAAQKAVDALQPELDEAVHTAEQAALLVNCEGYGIGRQLLDEPDKCATPPGFNGNYPRYVRESEAAAKRLAEVQAKMDEAQGRLATARKAQGKDQKVVLTDLQDKAPEEIARLEAKMANAQGVLASMQEELDGVNEGNDGLLARLEALERAGEEKPTLRWAHLLLALLFVVLETAPILGKTMFVFTKRYGVYEQQLALQEASAFNASHRVETHASQLAEAELDHELALKATELRLASLGAENELKVAQAKADNQLKMDLVAVETDLKIQQAREALRLRLAIKRDERLENEHSARIEQVLREQGNRVLDAWQAQQP